MEIKPRIGYIPFSYPDYPSDLVREFIEESVKSIRGLGVNVVEARPVISFQDVDKVISDLRGEELDLIVANLISWVEAPNVIAVLQEFKDKPILLWSHTMFKRGANS